MTKRRSDAEREGERLSAAGDPSVPAPFHAPVHAPPLAHGLSLPPAHVLDPSPAHAPALALPPFPWCAHVPVLAPFLSLAPGRVIGCSSSCVGERGSDGTCRRGCVSWGF